MFATVLVGALTFAPAAPTAALRTFGVGERERGGIPTAAPLHAFAAVNTKRPLHTLAPLSIHAV